MNKIYKLLFLLSVVAILFTGCSPENFALGGTDVKSTDLVEGIAYKIEHDATNPNIVYLTSLMGSKYTPLWNHPQGRSQEQKVTLKMPFAGTYEVQFGVETRAGVVYGDTVTFKVDNMYAEFVSDPLWTLISGGSGKEKTWYLDLDAEAVCRYFQGPLYFYGTNDSWESVTNGVKVGGDSWNWSPDYKGNSWLMTAADFGSMTFNLKGGANVIINHKTLSDRGTENAKYMLDTKNHTMKIQGGAILHDSGRDKVVIDWGNIKILSLTANTMQLAVLRDPTLSGEGACLLVYNFISKEYKDSWVAPVTVEPEPALPAGWQDAVSQTVSKSIKWVLSPTTPFNWANLDGSLMNADWTAPDKYADWTGFTAASAAGYANFSLSLNSDAKSVTYVAPNGTATTGSYTLDEKGIYTFNGVNPNFVISGGWVTLATTDANQWRITKIEKDAAGAVTGMWVGKRDAVKPEYMVYHLIPQLGTTAADPLAAWKKALIGKTFKPDTGWFVDWMKFDFTGGWTSAATFGTDYTSNNWIWTAKTSEIANTARIKFEANGSDIKATLTQDVYDASGVVTTAGYSVSGKVTIDPDIPSIKFEFPLVNYTGSPGAWLNTTNPKGANWAKPLGLNEWLYLPYGNATLGTIDTNGFWLGVISNSIAGGDTKDEVLGFHYILAN
jgi:hypothetical protein